jgi:FkbM family methyltransferase
MRNLMPRPPNIRHFVEAAYRTVRALPHLGVGGSLTLFRAHFGNRNYNITPSGYAHPLEVRGGTTDAKVLYDVFCRRDYPIVTDRPIRTILGAGANAGYTAVYFSHHYPQATILAIEPEHSNFAQLAKNSRPYSNIVPLFGALWPRHETVYIADPHTTKWAFSCSTTPPTPDAVPLPTFTVTQLMAAYCWQTIDLLKIDIEGGEKALFAENTAWLAETAQIFMEMHGDSDETVLRAVSRFPHTVQSKRRNHIFTFQHALQCAAVSMLVAPLLEFA